jgi:hypothetical protein
LIHAWAKDDKISRHTYNARSETAAVKPSYRTAWRQRQFGLVLVDDFYEPSYASGKAVRWKIELASGDPFGIACLWDRWTDSASGERVVSFSMLTVNADEHPVMNQFHKLGDKKCLGFWGNATHSIADAEIVLGIKQLLEESGLKVYVDWVEDAQLDRRAVSKETAAVLRQRMRQSKSLIYLSSENSNSSKWTPWELGYFDGFKPYGVAIMPVLDNSTDAFKGQKYLDLYPIVQRDTYRDGTPDVFVEERGLRWSTLKQFGRGQPLWSKYG